MIYLIEPNSDKNGHFFIYMNTLLNIPETVLCPMTIDFSALNNYNVFKKLYIITRSFYKLMKQVNKGEIVHLLYADIFYKIPFIANRLIKERHTIFTVHSCPNGKIKHFLMKNFYKNAKVVIVHSEFIKRQLEKIGLNNVALVHYPSFYNYDSIDNKHTLREKRNIPEDRVVLGALGGLRQDKGIDILIDSMKYIPYSLRNRIVLNIAGAPIDYSENDIRERCKMVDVRSNLTIRFLSDKEFMENVVLSDVMVFPYRSSMTANSGPMTEAMVNRIPCIVPARTNLASINELYDVGVTFEQENAKDLAKTIGKLLTTPQHFKFDITNELKIDTFVSRHKEIYNKIASL